MNTIYQTKAEALATEQRIRGIATSAYLGIATTTTTPPATGFFWYRVDVAGTYTNFKDASNNPIVVTAGDLLSNFVYIEVANGVSNVTDYLTDYVTDYVDVYVEDKKYGENLISNPSFTKGFTFWNKNQGFPVIIENGIAKMNALSGFTDPAIYQPNRPVVNGRNYIAILKVKNLGPTSNNFRVGISTHKVLFTIENSSEFKTYVVKFSKDTLDTNQLIVFGNPNGFNIELESFYVIDETNPLYAAFLQPAETVRLNTQLGILQDNIDDTNDSLVDFIKADYVIDYVEEKRYGENLMDNPSFLDGITSWGKNQPFPFTVEDGVAKINSIGYPDPGIYQTNRPVVNGRNYLAILRIKNLGPTSNNFRLGIATHKSIITIENSTEFKTYIIRFFKNTDDSNNFIVFSHPEGMNVELESFFVIDEFNPLYRALIQPSETVRIDSEIVAIKNNITSHTTRLDTQDSFNTTITNTLNGFNNNLSKSSYMPKLGFNKSPFYEELKPFFLKMLARTSDVTVVSIGDSITTDLNWTEKRPDANERPPFCTEFDINSMTEEKLRWKEQKYRRFDYAGVFTEILGGGTSTVKDVDPNWFSVGGAFQYPITKVIEGGLNAGISFEMGTDIRRLSLIVHTDSQFASSTLVTISGGAGKVEVWNGTAWVEAHNYTTSFKETELIPTTTSIIDNPHKRLKFRSLTNLSPKTITVTNVGTGRFGYWGIETSIREYMFTYVCAAKGSHNIDKLRRYEAYTVDAFNPDLVLQQVCILNLGVGESGRSVTSQDIADRFSVYYDDLKAKNYLIFPYILWVRGNGNFVDTNGNYTYFRNGTGKMFTVFDDIYTITKMYEDKGAPILNLFNRITEVGLKKAELEGGNLHTSASAGSGKNGNTFTNDGIHLNKLGNEVSWRMLNEYFNY